MMSLRSEEKIVEGLPLRLRDILMEDLAESTEMYAFQQPVSFSTTLSLRSVALAPSVPATLLLRGTDIESSSSSTCLKRSTHSSNRSSNKAH